MGIKLHLLDLDLKNDFNVSKDLPNYGIKKLEAYRPG